MSFRPEAIRGANGTGAVVDYRLTRQAVVREFRKGRLSRLDVCDAHPELRRAAAGAGTPTQEPCPICEEGHLQLVLRQKNVRVAHLFCIECTRCFGAFLPDGSPALAD